MGGQRGEGIIGFRAASAGQQRRREQRHRREDGDVQREYAGKAPDDEARRGARALVAERIAIIPPQDEARQDEEQIDGQIALGQHRDDALRREPAHSPANMIEHDRQRGDAAHARQGRQHDDGRPAAHRAGSGRERIGRHPSARSRRRQ